MSKDSSNTDDLLQGLEDGVSEFMPGSMQMIEEENEDEKPDAPVTLTNLEPKSPTKATTLTDLGKSGLTLAVIANLKLRMNRIAFTSGLKREDNPILEKARFLQVIRMYKVEQEKTKTFQTTISELQEQVLNEKEKITKLEEVNTDLTEKVKVSETVARFCPHGNCPLCLKQNQLENSDEKNATTEEDINLEEDTEESNIQDDNLEGTPNKLKRENTINYKKKLNTFKSTVGQSPDLGKKGKGREQNPALAIIEKLKTKKLGKFKNFMPLKSVLKLLQTIYTERINLTKENPSIKEEDIASFTYTYLLNTFGFKKIAEQKFIIFVLSLKKYLHIVRINLFSRFMGLLDGSSNYNVDEFNKYIEGIEFINNSTLGSPISNNDTDAKHFAPYLRCLEFLRYFSENKMGIQEYNDFKKEFETIKQADPKNINRVGIIDIDLFMTKILTKYRVICNKTKQYVVNAFKAADLDGNKYCSLKEFAILYKHIEADKYDFNFVENLFYEHADVRLGKEVNLSFDKFTVVCVEYGLFSDSQQDLFIEVSSPEELDAKMQSLKDNWKEYFNKISSDLETLAKVSEDEKKYWLDILNLLEGRISNPEAINANEYKTILIAFKILQKEVESFQEKETEVDEYGVKKVT
jgi:hypothetical protein